MKKWPTHWRLEDLLASAASNHASADGRTYYPARPLGLSTFANRVACALLVFQGHADAVTWPGRSIAMNPDDLRAIAEKAKTPSVTQDNWAAFEKAFPPSTCLALLDELDGLKARVESAEAVVLRTTTASHDSPVLASIAAQGVEHFDRYSDGKR